VYRRFVLIEGFVHGRHRPGIIRGMADRRIWKRRSGKRCGDFEAIFEWLNEHLPRPPREVFQQGKALCWFKPEARACLERMRALAEIHRALGASVGELREADPGRVTYEDDHQLVAVPALHARFRPLLREGFEVPIHVEVDDGQGDPEEWARAEAGLQLRPSRQAHAPGPILEGEGVLHRPNPAAQSRGIVDSLEDEPFRHAALEDSLPDAAPGRHALPRFPVGPQAAFDRPGDAQPEEQGWRQRHGRPAEQRPDFPARGPDLDGALIYEHVHY
jgi:hypothetical protein